MLGTTFVSSPLESLAFKDVKQHMQSLSPGMQSEAFTLLRLILVMPATNAVSERSASALRVKNYLRSTMSQS